MRDWHAFIADTGDKKSSTPRGETSVTVRHEDLLVDV
jgi:hypothetical protein